VQYGYLLKVIATPAVDIDKRSDFPAT